MLASFTVKNAAKKFLGRFFAFYRLFYVILSVVSLIAVWFFVPQPKGSLYYVGGNLFYLFKGTQTVAIMAFAFALTQFDMEEFLGINDARQFYSARLNDNRREPLNTGGFFAYVRHPLYLLTMTVLWTDPDMTIWWFVLSLCFSVYLIIGSFFEERKLAAIYGEEYRQYQRRVRRFLPIKKRVES